MNAPAFLTLEEVLHIHVRSLAEHGGTEGVRDRGLVGSALASARNTYYYGYGDVFDVAGAFAFHLAEAQAFLDGNKRTGVTAALVFLARNGVYAAPPKWEFYNAMIAIAEKRLTKADLATILRREAQVTSEPQP